MEENTEAVTSALEAARSSILAQDASSFALHCKELIKALGQAGEHASRVLQVHESLAPEAAGRLLISGALVLTTDVFGFCKEVDVDHRWALDGFSDLLGTMFKANMNLLRLLFDTLDKALPGQEHKDRSVVVSLWGLCVEVLNFDTTLVLHAWRTLVKELGKCRAVLGQEEEEETVNSVLGLSDLAQDLCTATVVTYGKCLELARSGSPEFQRHLKACKHLLSLLMVVLRDVDDGSGDTLPYYKVLLKLFSDVPPSLAGHHIPSGPLQSISTVLLSVSEPLLQLMTARRCFAQQLLSRDVLERGQGYAWCVCLVKVMGMFDRVPGGLQNNYLCTANSLESSQGCPLLEAAFECVKFCHTELALSTPSLPGASSTSLYQSLCTNLCALLAQLNPEHWSSVEATLFRYALCGEPNCSVLAADVWSFLWRWGTADLCRLNAFLLAHTVLSLPPGPSLQRMALTRLADRAVTFMAAGHKSDFIQAYSPAVNDHLRLWSVLSLHHFPANQQKQAIGQLMVLTSTCVEQALEGRTDNYEDLYHALGTLCRVYEVPEGACRVDPSHHTKLMSLVPRICEWALLITDLEGSPVAQSLVSTLMQFTSLALPSLPVQDTGRVLSCASHLVHTSSCLAVLLSAIPLLSACHQVSVPPGQEVHCLAPVSALARLLLSSTHWLLRNEALEAFKVFAQNTPYGRVAEQCIPEQLSDTVVDYLNQVPCGIRESPSALAQQVVHRVQARYRSLEEKLAVSESVGSQVVDLTGDCEVEAVDKIGASDSLDLDGGTLGTLSFDGGLQLMLEGWQAVQEAGWEGRDLSALSELQLSMAQQLERHCCSLQH